MGVLACGSGRKLKSAVQRTLISPQAPAIPSASFAQQWKVRNGVQLTGSTWQSLGLQQRGRFSNRRHIHTLMRAKDSARPSPGGWSDVPNPRSPAACAAGEASWISDPASLLPSQEKERLEQVLDQIYIITGSQCALVALAGLHGHDSDSSRFRQFAVHLFNHWRVGSALHNNGVLIVLFQEDRRLEIVTGIGMSAALPDRWLLAMQQQFMVPHFRAGDHSAGLIAGVVKIRSQLVQRAPRDWRSVHSPVLEGQRGDFPLLPTSDFSGGKALVSPRASSSGSSQPKHGDEICRLLGGGFLLACALLGDDDERRLQKQLDGLRAKPVFKDSAGVELPWPYAVAPARMTGLVDACSPGRGLHEEEHAFLLAADGSLELQCRAAGFGAHGLELSLFNLGSKSLTVELPAGSLFVARGAPFRTQPLITQETLTVQLAPGEQRTLPVDVYCGDSHGSVPRCHMTLSQYVLEKEHLGSQRSVWQWSAGFQPMSGGAALPASEDFQTLEESFGMSQAEVRSMLDELDAIARRSDAARQQEVVDVRNQISAARQLREARSSSSGSRSSGGGSFGGGRSSGGGAGCSW